MFSVKLTIISVFVALCSVFLYFKVVPNIPDPRQGVLFYYQCRNYGNRVLLNSGPSEKKTPVPRGQPLFVLIPGYTESSLRQWINVVTKALLEAKPSSCVLIVDHWNYLTLSRPFMTSNVGIIAHSIAEFLIALESKSGLRFSNIHIVGFSLGGWVSGMISNFLPEGKKLGRITGIDSSFPWTETDNASDFLDSKDAETVVLIRTSRISKKIPPVEIDFHVNGGEVQPECDIWWHPDFVQQICSHYKAPFLFVSRLLEENSSFTACHCPDRKSLLQGICPCDVRNSFGLNTVTNLKGNFYLEMQLEDRE